MSSRAVKLDYEGYDAADKNAHLDEENTPI
jgi:hypothetical protein